MAENDVQLDLKKRARRRLVGAIALALLAAIVLPMVMDSEPKPGSHELSIRIPSQEGGNYASRLITGAAPPPASPVLPAQSVVPPVPLPVPVEAAPVVAQSKAASPVSVSQSSPVATQSAPVKAAEKSRSDELRARELLEGKSSSAAASGKFFVQLGVYREESNARELANRAGAQGVKVSLEKLSDRTTRVRSGPYVERAAADKVLEKLKKAGIEARLVTGK